MIKSLLSFSFVVGSFAFANAQLPGECPQVKNIREQYAQLLCMKEGMKAQEKIISQLPIEAQNGDICVKEIYLRFYPVDSKEIQSYIDYLNDKGSWSDIDYKAQNISGWPPAAHQVRLLKMVKYHRAMNDGDTATFSKNELEASIHRALVGWYDKKLVSRNWWQNCIGTPKILGASLLLFRDYLSVEEMRMGQEMLEKQYKLWFTPTGQNRVWMCEAKLLAALFRNDYKTVAEMRDEFLKQIVAGENEGIQDDWSFHQHGAQQQMGNYGLSFLMSMSFFSALFEGTELAFPKDKQEILNELYLKGYQWMRWGEILDMNAMGRQISRNVMKQKGVSTYVAGQMLQENNTPEEKSQLANSLPANQLLGQKHFAESELTIHRNKNWMASLRMASNRLIGAEICNNDGRISSFMGDGALYIYKSLDGYEYENILPLWNPRLIPGITCMASDKSAQDLVARNKTSFVGGVTDGKSGITSMELNRYGVHAFKSWVITDEWVFCLGSDLRCDSKGLLTTAVANRISRDPLYHEENGKWVEVKGDFVAKDSPCVRLYHDGMAYIVMGTKSLTATNSLQSGDWHDVSEYYPKGMIHQDKLLTVYLEHKDGEQDYQYFILPSISKEEAASFDISSVKVLYQNADIHAVQVGESCYVSIRKAGDYKLPFSDTVRLVKPGMYLVQKIDGAWTVKRSVYP